MLVGLGCQWLLLKPPKKERRIPKAVRRAVIARDLTSKGLKWDPERHHIDHVVPFSRGGDHSTRNLRVMEKQRNLSKADKMPSFWDFLKR
jgi:5-methylcytosine-specific restriction endonuclease McrA